MVVGFHPEVVVVHTVDIIRILAVVQQTTSVKWERFRQRFFNEGPRRKRRQNG